MIRSSYFVLRMLVVIYGEGLQSEGRFLPSFSKTLQKPYPVWSFTRNVRLFDQQTGWSFRNVELFFSLIKIKNKLWCPQFTYQWSFRSVFIFLSRPHFYDRLLPKWNFILVLTSDSHYVKVTIFSAEFFKVSHCETIRLEKKSVFNSHLFLTNHANLIVVEKIS